MFLLRNENTVMANTAAINKKQHGRANNEKLKLETLVHSVGANLQAIIQIINSLRIKKDENLLKGGWKIEKLENSQPIFFKYILWKQSLACSEKSLDH